MLCIYSYCIVWIPKLWNYVKHWSKNFARKQKDLLSTSKLPLNVSCINEQQQTTSAHNHIILHFTLPFRGQKGWKTPSHFTGLTFVWVSCQNVYANDCGNDGSEIKRKRKKAFGIKAQWPDGHKIVFGMFTTSSGT